MPGKSDTRRAERVIQWFAVRQFGTVARRQLLEAGVSRHAIDSRIAAGRLTELHRGVYLVGQVKPNHANEMAALLAFRLRATLSHRTALKLWGLSPSSASEPVWVTVPPRMGSQRARLKVVRAELHARDIRDRNGLRVTSPPRTILDMAALTPEPYELERIVAEAHFRGLATEAELQAQLERSPGKRGNRTLRAVLGLPGGPRRTRSGGERALLRFLRERGIGGYVVNATICGYEVDFLWRAERVVVEVDGWDGHSSRQAFERDRLKWSRIQANGIAVMPVTARQIRDDADGVAERILAALGR